MAQHISIGFGLPYNPNQTNNPYNGWDPTNPYSSSNLPFPTNQPAIWLVSPNYNRFNFGANATTATTLYFTLFPLGDYVNMPTETGGAGQIANPMCGPGFPSGAGALSFATNGVVFNDPKTLQSHGLSQPIQNPNNPMQYQMSIPANLKIPPSKSFSYTISVVYCGVTFTHDPVITNEN